MIKYTHPCHVSPRITTNRSLLRFVQNSIPPGQIKCRNLSTVTAEDRYSGFRDICDKPASAYGWRYHLDNTIQFILWASVGSAAIHLLNIKQEYKEKERRLSTKIAILRDVIKRVGQGEDVDIARELQVGRTEEEKEWEEVLASFREAAGLTEEEQSTQATASTKTQSVGSTMSNAQGIDHDTLKDRGNILKATSRGWFWQS